MSGEWWGISGHCERSEAKCGNPVKKSGTLRCGTATKLLVRRFTVGIGTTCTGKAVPQIASAIVTQRSVPPFTGLPPSLRLLSMTVLAQTIALLLCRSEL